MNIRNMKTTLLVLLIAGVILQIVRLWLEESSGHNLFSSFTALSVSPREEKHRIEPVSIMINLGNTKYIKVYDGKNAGIKEISDERMAMLINSGVYVETRPLDWVSLLSGKSVLYEYPFTINTEDYARSFGYPGADFTSKAKVFDTIIIKPARTSSEPISFYVVDTVFGTTHFFEGPRGVSEPLSREIDSIMQISHSGETDINYISSVQDSLDFFTDNTFLPEWHTHAYNYVKAYAANPVEEIDNLEKCAQLFFDNPIGLLSAVDPAGVPFVSDKETVVKYYSDLGVLEFTNYGVQKIKRVTFDAAFAIACNFMDRDQTLENEVYITEAVFENGMWSLYFDYYWNGLRVYGDTFDHAIEIVVSGETVTKYRRVVKRISDSEITGQLTESSIAVLDRVLSETGGEKITRMELGYMLSESGFCDMDWIVEHNNKEE